MQRLTARFWVDAYLMRLQLQDIPAYVVSHGDDTAGTVLVKLSTLDGQATLFQRSYDILEDTRFWSVSEQGSEADIDDTIARQCARDPDLWVIEIEDRHGRHLLDEPGLN